MLGSGYCKFNNGNKKGVGMYLIEPIRHGKRITDGAVALAMQVYVQQTIFLDDDILFPYYCDPKVEIGKYQNAIIEVNQDYLKNIIFLWSDEILVVVLFMLIQVPLIFVI